MHDNLPMNDDMRILPAFAPDDPSGEFILPTKTVGEAFDRLARSAETMYEDTADNRHGNYRVKSWALNDAALAYARTVAQRP
jgi:hypothetical protein